MPRQPAVKVAVQPRRRDQGDEVVYELQRGEGQRGAPVASGLGQAIDDPLIVGLFDALKGEGRACAVAQQPFQSGPVVAGDTHASIERKPTVLPGQHVAGVVRIEQLVVGEPAQHPAADLRFDHGSGFPRQCGCLSELDPTAFERLEHPVEDEAVIVQMAIERSTETVDETHRPEACPRRGSGTASAQMGLDHTQEDIQHGGDCLWLPFQVPAQPLGYRQHPLAHRQGWEDVIDQVGGGLGQAPGIARGADATSLVGEGHQEIVAARGTGGAGEAVGQDAALQVAAQLALHVAGYRVPNRPRLRTPARGRSPGAAGRGGTGRFARGDDGRRQPGGIPGDWRPCRRQGMITRVAVFMYSIAG